MENGQIPPVQPMQVAQPNVATYGATNGVPTAPAVSQGQVATGQKKDNSGLIKTIIIIALSLVALTFAGLFVWMTIQYNEANGDVQDKIDIAVVKAKDEQAAKMEAEFLEREKYPYKTFLGPEDYGQLSFEYPRTWSVYVAADAVNGGDFNAYFNPDQVNAVGNNNINALRLVILNKSFSNVVAAYQQYVDKATLQVESITVNDTTANKYYGKIPNTSFNGYILVIKIRDKTAILQTDSVLFESDFNKIINTITFNA